MRLMLSGTTVVKFNKIYINFEDKYVSYLKSI